MMVNKSYLLESQCTCLNSSLRNSILSQCWDSMAFTLAGNAAAAADAQGLEDRSVGFVLNCCERVPFGSDRTQNLLLKLRDRPHEQLRPHLPQAMSFLALAKASSSTCLVHCFQGISRSPSIVLAYLVSCELLSLARAWALLRNCFCHVAPRPNRSFAEQLISLDKEVHGAPSATLADFGYDDQ